MKIKTINAPAVGGGKALALCDDEGRVIGTQIVCTVDSQVGTVPVVTVKLLVDGETLTLGEMC